MNNFKKFTILLFVLLLSGFLALGLLVFIIDPYFQYHAPLKHFNYVIDDQLTQNPGMARNLKYDAVILGSSVTVNFDASWFNEDFNLNTIKLPYNGAYPKDYANILSQIEMSDNDLKYVFWTMDVGSFSGRTDETKYPIQNNLYDRNPLNDVTYFINKDILHKYIIMPMLTKNKSGLYNLSNDSDSYAEMLGSSMGNDSSIAAGSSMGIKIYGDKINNAYSTYQDLNYNKDACFTNFTDYNPNIDSDKVLNIVNNHVSVSTLYPDTLLDENDFLANSKANMEENILPFIKAHPDTKFIISFPPYSILNWAIYANNGSLPALEKEYELVINELLQYDNVTIYFFCNDKDIIYNLDLYADALHYNRDINYFMEQEFANPESKYIINKDTNILTLFNF